MEWSAIGQIWLSTLGWLVGLAVGFGIVVRLTPCNPGMYWWKDLRAVATDLLYWFLVPLVVRFGRMVMLVLAVAFLFGAREPGWPAVGRMPLWGQCLGILVIQDVFLYASHRIFHSRLAWRFHAIHHSPKVLDWMSTSRFHPVNILLSGAAADVVVLLMGFSVGVLLVLIPFNLVYSAMVHANLNWTFGPFRYVFASPVFHRWHHTTLVEGLNKNFASTFPVLDLVFGTFYMPAGKLPEQFGNGEPDFPEGFWGQFFHPFRIAEPAGAREGIFAWAKRRPVAASLLMLSVLGLAGLVVGGVRFAGRLQDRNDQLLRDLEQAKARQSRTETAHHALQMDLARRAWEDNDLASASAILDQVDEAFQQTAEQRYLRELCRRKCLILKGHERSVYSVAISGDGTHVVSGGGDGTVRVWETETGKEKLILKGHRRGVRGVAISGDGNTIVSGSFDGTVIIHDARTGRVVNTLTGHEGGVLCVAISADGKRIVSGSGDLTAKVWVHRQGRRSSRFPRRWALS
jgi:sterol desaturase/sphingolipid hydroxylase (fatty acid hydroxylase superfamily)